MFLRVFGRAESNLGSFHASLVIVCGADADAGKFFFKFFLVFCYYLIAANQENFYCVSWVSVCNISV
jgi:hypothetical protein